jgi:hypothetical protein
VPRQRQGVLQGVELLLPVDVVCTRDLDSNDVCCVQPLNDTCCTPANPCLPDDAFGADLGPATCARFAAALAGSRTIFWNGPMGRYEQPAFAAATAAVAQAVADATAAGATTIIGGALRTVTMPSPCCGSSGSEALHLSHHAIACMTSWRFSFSSDHVREGGATCRGRLGVCTEEPGAGAAGVACVHRRRRRARAARGQGPSGAAGAAAAQGPSQYTRILASASAAAA